MAEGYVYIMASSKGGKLYTGATTDLVRRVDEHRRGAYDGYTRQHVIKTLVYYERHDSTTTRL